MERMDLNDAITRLEAEIPEGHAARQPLDDLLWWLGLCRKYLRFISNAIPDSTDDCRMLAQAALDGIDGITPHWEAG